MTRLLILGGTGEARQLAARLSELGDPALEVITSLAGRTRAPIVPAGVLRRGGFGGVDGLSQFLTQKGVDIVIDATHPYAAQISANAAAACEALNVPLLRIDRPAWTPQSGDRWHRVPDADHAARLLPQLGRRALVTIGAQGLAPFAALRDVKLVIRLIELPDPSLSFGMAVILRQRGPFSIEEERALFHQHCISVLVTKNAGGGDTAPKLAAAREAGIPVIMIDRPPTPAGPSVDTADAALDWLRPRISSL